MTASVQSILTPLDPHWDRIIRRPLSKSEVDDLQRQVGLPVPEPLRDYLMAVGLFQDLTYWQASPFEVFDSTARIVSARRFLCDLLPPKYHGLFPLGDDGAGNVFCVPTGPDVACRLQFVDLETRKVSAKKDFLVWLEGVVKKVLSGIRRRVPNAHKVWAVQFAFGGIPYGQLKSLLVSAGKFREVDSDWKPAPPDEDAEVAEAERHIDLNGTQLKLTRMESEDWDAPRFHFDMREPLANGLEQSQIRRLHALFKVKCPGYRLIDYGPLDSRKLE